MMPQSPSSDDVLRAALHGVRAMMLDADGVVVLKGRAIPGARDALRGLSSAGIPYRIVTNFYAESERIHPDRVVQMLLEAVPAPKSGLG